MLVNPMFPKRSILIDWLIEIELRFGKSWRAALFENEDKIGSENKDEDKK